MHLEYAYIGSGKNGNAVSWGRMKKQCRIVKGILTDFDKKSFRNLRCAQRGAWKMKQGKICRKISACIQQKEKAESAETSTQIVNNRQNGYEKLYKTEKKKDGC